ncbi:MAG: PAS domain-containing protein [Burkholderiaceae bacterium]
MPGVQVRDTGRVQRRVWLRITLAALLASLAGVAAVTLRFAAQAERSLEDVDRQAALSARGRDLDGVLQALADAESAQRAWLMTGDATWRAAWRDAVDRLPPLMHALDAEAGHDPANAGRAAADARVAIADKLAELTEGMRLQAAGQHAQALALLASDKSRDAAARALRAVDDMREAVRGTQDAIGARIAAGVTSIRRLLVAAVASLALFIALALAQTLQTLGARTRFEARLGASEERHRALVEDQSELVSLAREDGTLVYVNPAYARAFGRTPEALLGTSLYDLVEPSERDAVRQQVAGVMRTGRERDGENRNIGQDGVERWVGWTNKRRQEPEGALLHSVGRDVTERKRAERGLRASQAFLQRTSELAGIGGWELDLRSGEFTWSEQVRRILEIDDGHTPTHEEVVSGYAHEARDTLRQAMDDCVERGVPWDLELPRVAGGNRRTWVRTVGSLELERGQPRRIVGALQDVTERKRLEQRLADSERFVRQVTDHLPMRIAFFDAHLRYRFVNAAHCRRYGRPREEIIGRTRAEFSGGSGDAAIEPYVAAALRGEPQDFEYDETLQGVTRRMHTQLVPDLGEDGRVRGFHATSIDVTERAASERRLRELTQIAELSPDYILQATRQGAIEYLNPALRRALGLAPGASLAGLRTEDLATAESDARHADDVQPALRAHGSWRGETTLKLAGGRCTPVSHLVIAHHGADGRVERLSAVMRDISGEVAARDALTLQTATLQSVIEALPALVAVVGTDGRYRFVNAAFERWAGLPRTALLGRGVPEVVGPALHAACEPWIARALAGETVSLESVDPSRRLRDLAVTYIPLRTGGAVDGYVGVGQLLLRPGEVPGTSPTLARRDALTGLLDRPGLEAWLAAHDGEALAGSLALVCVDLDGFRPVNDAWGHPAGDRVLCEFARRLQAVVRPGDAVARLGGDRFALALAGVRERAHGEALARKAIAAAAQPFEVDAQVVRVGASAGLAWRIARDGETPPDLLAHAVVRLVQAKAGHRGSVA